MTAREFFTQEKVDKLQYETDDNNGIIDEDFIINLMEEYKTFEVNIKIESAEELKVLKEAIADTPYHFGSSLYYALEKMN